MPKSNGAPRDSPKTPPAITSLSVSGFKSIVERQKLAIRPLTLLAGANSSGKSSMMQPLLLLKQTLEAPYDPGPLLLDGTNGRFTSARQFRPVGSPRDRVIILMVWLEISDERNFIVAFRSHESKPIELASNAIVQEGHKTIIDESTKFDEFALLSRLRSSPDLIQRIKAATGGGRLEVARDRFFVRPVLDDVPESMFLLLDYYKFMEMIARLIAGVIHISGLRGNPERTYSVTSVETAYPGTFDHYVASLIARWGSESPGRVRQVVDTPTAKARGILSSTITAICRWSYTISLSVRPSEDGPVPVCPTVRIWRVRLTTIPTAIRSLASLVIARPSSFVPSWFYAGKGFLPATGNHEFSKNGPRRDVFKHTIVRRSHQDRTPSSHP